MGELKSAWEIALEKADKLGKLSIEEEQQQKEQICLQIAQAATQKCLNIEAYNIAKEVSSYSEEEKNLITQATITYLIESIDLKSPSKLERATRSIVDLEPKLQPILEKIIQLTQEYEQIRKKTRQDLQSKTKGILHRLRISGTAVGDINVEALSQWKQAEQKLVESWQPKLDSLKQELIAAGR